MPPKLSIEDVSGVLRYQGAAAILREDDARESLLILDKPPLGHFDIEDIAAASSLYRDFMGKQDGDRVRLSGIRSRFVSRPAILIVRA